MGIPQGLIFWPSSFIIYINSFSFLFKDLCYIDELFFDDNSLIFKTRMKLILTMPRYDVVLRRAIICKESNKNT